jgi:flavin reductase (DIM6/NTAB) family NADH-FMN oxidoreductase RutF
MLFDFETLEPMQRYKLLLATVMPRPIAWVTSLDTDGRLNAAPFSFFNAFAADPPTVALGVGNHAPGRLKDTKRNILDTQEFVVNLVSYSVREAMLITSIPFPPGTDELAEAGLTTVPSDKVAPPRIAKSPVSMECRLLQLVPLGNFGLILGQVLRMHVRDEAVLDATRQHIDAEKLDLIGRMEGGWYMRTTTRFEMPPIPLEDWNGRQR